MASKTISFRIFLNDQLVDTRSFDQEVIKLGRLASSHLRLDHDAIGRMHAVIEVGHDGNARLVDLGSHTGTRLNGNLIEGSHALRNGDKLELGPYRLELAIAEPMPQLHMQMQRAVASAPAVQQQAAQPQVAVDLAKVEDSREQVAEVVATYGRSILDVAHVGQARDRKRSAMPLLALGGVLMAGGVGLFGYEVAQPWDEYNAAAVEARQSHRELPEAPGLGTGSLGLVLALLGIVPFLAGSLRLREQTISSYTIGEGSEANFKVSGSALPNPAATPLVERLDGGYALAFTPAMNGAIELGGQQVSLAELVASGRASARDGHYVYPLPASAKARIEHGDIRFNINLVNRGAVVAGRGEVDWPFWGYFGGTATIATAFYMLMRSLPDDALAFQVEDDDGQPRYAAYFHQADEKVEVEPADEPIPEVAEQGDNGGEAGSRAKGPEGTMGDKRSRNSARAYAMAGPSDAVPQISRTFDPDAAARTAGILGVLATQEGHFLASLDGGPYSIGNADEDVWGNLVGTEVGEAYGVGGLGLVGTGRGGGGNGAGVIGIGNHGLIGHGTGTGGTGYGPGDGGVVGFGKREKKPPVVYVSDGKVTGDIDKDLIRRIVRSHINEVRSCYNAGLTRDPNLGGRVTINFSIVGNGKVSSSVVQENTTRDSEVANCIAKAVKRWKFPRVGNGGTAMVSYPFRLTAG